ncbi:universal stress protein [Kovacikia minuta CCNUW1]|uniref:universal stress protein n=1 Tax=Kovacikia minuta TaxID=2931930 RepID=UPI001CCD9BBA|nr:universal stress protein [Kovacikia minuta]UBF29009.1 universal stress protein [Kovacikia minuta CCNUW1]
MIQVNSPVLFPPLLLATDGSSSARLAQKLLYPIAQTLQDQRASNGRSLVTVLTVQPRQSSRSNQLLKKIRRLPDQASDPELPAQTEPMTLPERLDSISESHLSPSPTHLIDLFHTDFPADFPVSVEVRRGRPAIEILNYARTIRAGLIAVGSRGTSGVRELLLGSVSAVVARYAPCSVLVARGATTETSAEPSLNHVLLVVGTSQGTQQAIAATRQLISAGVHRVTILCPQTALNAEYLFGPFVAPTPSWQLNQSLQEARREQGEALLHQAKTALNLPNLEIQTLLQTSEPGPLICQVAQQQQIDLIILGSDASRRTIFNIPQLGRNRSSGGESLLDPLHPLRKQKGQEDGNNHLPALRNARLSTTEDYTIHHAPCPVLLCRPPYP